VLGHVALAIPLELPGFLNNGHMKMVKLLGPGTGLLYPLPHGIALVVISVGG